MAEITNLLAEFISRLNLSEEIAQTFAEGGRVATIRGRIRGKTRGVVPLYNCHTGGYF